ncbi:copper homeostasis periplasmic binding protein CopC [Rhodoblastus sp.]|uniref:copper homeostasis periplasmic binding protein CopC n=1 Tax=Rhodoblastus sp. TaxID=1962975 RepID=UPI002627E798|nr:copper homeostasis periplasmic binding protein CopC [Rhodoblastus sp.]
MQEKLRRRTLVSVLSFCAMVESASAHAHLQSANPAPDSIVATAPQEVWIAFSEAVEPSMSAIEIVGVQGPVAATGKAYVDQAAPAALIVKLAQPLPAGAYETRWRCVGKDSHAMRGSYHFEVRP